MRSYPSRISVGASTKAENIAHKTAKRLGALKVSIFPARYRVSTDSNTIPRQVFQDCLLDALCVFGNVCATPSDGCNEWNYFISPRQPVLEEDMLRVYKRTRYFVQIIETFSVLSKYPIQTYRVYTEHLFTSYYLLYVDSLLS